jgi:hypothetical protein
MFLIRRGEREYTSIVGPGVMMAGFDDRFLVAVVEEPDFENPDKRHPRQYFYVDRLITEKDRTGMKGIVGPLSSEAFDHHDQRLELPDFTWLNDGV